MGDGQDLADSVEDELAGHSVEMALDTIRDWISNFETVALIHGEVPSIRAAAEQRPERLCSAVSAAVPALATIYHPSVVREIVAILRGAELAIQTRGAAAADLEHRVQALEQVVAGAGAVLASPPAPSPRDKPRERLDVLESTMTGAGAVLRSLAD